MVSYSSWQREGCKTEYPGVAKFGIALEWGSRGRWFESSHSDHRSILRDAPIFLLLKGLRVIPTVNWGDESTFDFCFEGIEKGSVVAVSTYMASEHNNRCDQKEWFMAGYQEMLRRIEPEKSSVTIHRFPKCRATLSMWITNAVPGGI